MTFRFYTFQTLRVLSVINYTILYLLAKTELLFRVQMEKASGKGGCEYVE
jgi:hypothetical protein